MNGGWVGYETTMNNEDQKTIRDLNCEINVLSRTDGSALFSQGETTIMAAVYGPVEVKPMKLLIDRASIEAVFRSKSGLPCVADRLRESLIRNTCHAAIVASSYPKTSIEITVQEMQDSGGVMACAINASCMALVNAGVAMNFLFAAVNCMVDADDRVILDPNSRQLKDAKASLMFVFDSVDKNVVTTHTTGCFSPEKFQECLLQCQLASDTIFKFYRDMVSKYANKVVA